MVQKGGLGIAVEALRGVRVGLFLGIQGFQADS